MKLILLSFLTFVCFSITGYSQWIQTAGIPQGGGVTDMVALSDGTIIVTTASFNWPQTSTKGGIRRSTNGGASWENTVDVYNARTLCLGTTGKLFASYWPYPSSEALVYSTNSGALWISGYSIGANNNIFSIVTGNNDQTVFIGTRNGVLKSTNGGLNFTVTGSGIPANTFVYDLDADSSGTFIAAGTSKGLYITSNSGSSWASASGISGSDTVYTVKFIKSQGDLGEDNLLFSGTSEGKIFTSSPGAQYLTAILVYAFFGKLDDIQVVGNGQITMIAIALAPFNSDNSTGSGLYFSTDMAATWNDNSSGLPSNPVVSRVTLGISGGNINWYTGLFNNSSDGAKIYKMTAPIGIGQVSNEVPEGFSLSQNYPNPFNPMTKIKFNLSKASNVSVTVFDVLGRHITTLVNEKLGAGTYETEWNANNMPGGVYFYRIEAEDFSETRKMILVK